MLLLLPVAYLLRAGRWWALAHPARDGHAAGRRSRRRSSTRSSFCGRRSSRRSGRDPRAPGAPAVTARDRRDGSPDRPRRRSASSSSPSRRSSTGWRDRDFDAGRGDFFYLADAFLHGRTWLDVPARPVRRDHRRRPLLRPVRAVPGGRARCRSSRVIGPVDRGPGRVGHQRGPCGGGVGLCWMLLGRIGVRRLVDRLWLAILFGFSTQILWVTTRGGVWHTGPSHRDDPDLRLPHRAVGQAAGVAHRAARRGRVPDPRAARLRDPVLRPDARAAPARPADRVVRWLRRPSVARRIPWRAWGLLGARRPAVDRRSSSPTTRSASGRRWNRATRWRRCRRSSRRSGRSGLFSLAHVPMNLDYFLFHLPEARSRTSRSSGPTASGMSVFITSPGLLFAIRADWRRPRAWWLLGGRGRRPHPDAPLLRRRLAPVRLPLLPRLGAVRHRPVRACAAATAAGSAWAGGSLIAFGVVIMFVGVYWAYGI